MIGYSTSAEAYAEVAKAIKPFISKDETRPALTKVRLRYQGGTARVEATDSYGYIAADFQVWDASDQFDVIVPGAEFCSLKPGRRVEVSFRVVDDEACEISDGTTTVRLERFDGEYPDGDKIMVRLRGTIQEIPQGIGINGHLFKRLASLPKMPLHLRFTEARGPVLAACGGHADYQVAIMSVALDDRPMPVWQPWQAPVAA